MATAAIARAVALMVILSLLILYSFQFCMFNLNITYHNLRFTPMPNRCMEFLKSNLYSAVTKRLSTIS